MKTELVIVAIIAVIAIIAVGAMVAMSGEEETKETGVIQVIVYSRDYAGNYHIYIDDELVDSKYIDVDQKYTMQISNKEVGLHTVDLHYENDLIRTASVTVTNGGIATVEFDLNE